MVSATAAAQTLPGSNVGTAAAAHQVSFTITASGPVGTTAVLTQGAPNLDFTLGSDSTCTGNVPTGTCYVNVIFNPTTPGLRMGAVELTSSSGTIVATAYIQATGTGPLVTFTPGVISTYAGNGTRGFTGDGSAAIYAELHAPYGVALDGAGNVFIADNANNRIRKVTAATGIISTYAGNGTAGYMSADDGNLAINAELNEPLSVAVDGAGNVYIADTYNQRVRKVTTAGIISTYAGNGNGGYLASQNGGQATAADLNYPTGVTVDGANNLYISDYENQRVRKVTAAGIISNYAGTGTGGYVAAQDGGQATMAEIDLPRGLAVDGAGNLFIADYGNNLIRKVTTAGVITTVAGNSTAGFSGDGSLATGAELNEPFGVAVDGGGNLYIADFENNRIRKVAAATSIITTVAGTLYSGETNDGGAATSAELSIPSDVALDSAGNLYIADQNNARIREVTATVAPPLFPDTSVGSTSAVQTVTVNNIGNASLTLPIPASGFNPTLVGSNYALSNSSTCPQPSATSGSAGIIRMGDSCTEILSYTPTAAGPSAGYLQFTDNNLNATNATQKFSFSGTTTSSSVLTLTAENASITAGTASVTLTFIAGYGNNPPPSSTPTLIVAGSTSGVGAISCVSKAGHTNCSAPYNSSALTHGMYTIQVTQPADSNYTADTTATAVLTVN